MRRLKLILTIAFFASSHFTFACSCFSAEPFLTVAPTSEFVALVKVTKYMSFGGIYDKQTPMSMEVEVIDVYKGKETRKTLKVWGDNGILCRPYLSVFQPGNYYVIAFYRASDGSQGQVHQDERPTDYAISICGDYWLKADMDKRKAVGSVTKKQLEISFSALKKELASSNELSKQDGILIQKTRFAKKPGILMRDTTLSGNRFDYQWHVGPNENAQLTPTTFHLPAFLVDSALAVYCDSILLADSKSEKIRLTSYPNKKYSTLIKKYMRLYIGYIDNLGDTNIVVQFISLKEFQKRQLIYAKELFLVVPQKELHFAIIKIGNESA